VLNGELDAAATRIEEMTSGGPLGMQGVTIAITMRNASAMDASARHRVGRAYDAKYRWPWRRRRFERALDAAIAAMDSLGGAADAVHAEVLSATAELFSDDPVFAMALRTATIGTFAGSNTDHRMLTGPLDAGFE
jgi:hypothetical protein